MLELPAEVEPDGGCSRQEAAAVVGAAATGDVAARAWAAAPTMPAVAPYAASWIGAGWRMTRMVSASAYALRTGRRSRAVTRGDAAESFAAPELVADKTGVDSGVAVAFNPATERATVAYGAADAQFMPITSVATRDPISP